MDAWKTARRRASRSTDSESNPDVASTRVELEEDASPGFSVGEDLQSVREDEAEAAGRRASRRETSSGEQRKQDADDAEDMTSRLLRAKKRATGGEEDGPHG